MTNIVATQGEPAVVVVSALSPLTDALLKSVETRNPAGLEPLFARHQAVATELLDGTGRDIVRGELAEARGAIERLLARVTGRPPRSPGGAR